MSDDRALSVRRALPVFGMALAIAVLLLAIIGPVLAPRAIDETSTGSWMPSDGVLLFGSDSLGRDVWSRTLAGGRRLVLLAGLTALLTVALAAGGGLLLGFGRGHRSRRLRTGVRMLVDLASAIPFLVIALALTQRLPQDAAVVMAGLASSVPLSTLVIADQVRRISGAGFVEVARSRGETNRTIAVREVLPALRGQLAADLSVRFVTAVQVMAALAVIGYAPSPPAADWAAMIRENLPGVDLAPGAVLAPAVALCAIGVAAAILGSAAATPRRSQGSAITGQGSVLTGAARTPQQPEPLVAVRDLVVSSRGGGCLLRIPQFELRPGETIAITGPSGSGKTLAVLAMLGIVPAGLCRTGSVRLAGRIRGAWATRRFRHDRVRWVSQDPASALHPLLRPIDLVVPSIHAPRAARRRQAVELLAELGLQGEVIHRRADSLSGGQAARVALARAFAADDALVVLDEPTAALDPACTALAVELIRRRRGGPGATLVITHDLSLLQTGGPGDHGSDQGGDRAVFDQILAVRPAHVQLPDSAGVPPRPSVDEQDRQRSAAAPALVVSGLTVVRGDREIVTGLDLTLYPGELVALVGPSGCGKSTAVRAIAGLLPFRGTVEVNEAAAVRDAGAPARSPEMLRCLRFVGQDPLDALNPAHRIITQVARSAQVLGRSDDVAPGKQRSRQHAQAALDSVGLRGLEDRRPGELSGGQRQRAALARALVVDPGVLLADEITSALDAGTAAALLAQLRRICDRGTAVLLTTHDPDVAARADRVVTVGGLTPGGTASTPGVTDRGSPPALTTGAS